MVFFFVGALMCLEPKSSCCDGAFILNEILFVYDKNLNIIAPRN
jgi:hypothetical protein